MKATDPSGPVRLSIRLRLTLAVAGVAGLVLLAVAGRLRPDPRGLGTHQQLGLPPCTFAWLFGRRCPSCGMTTSWAYAVRGKWGRAVEASAGGALLAAIALVAVPWLGVSAGRGRWLGGLPGDRTLAAVAVAVVIVTLVDWLCRLAAG